MLSQHRLEIVLVAVIAIVAAVGVRIAYQPVDPDGLIERTESLYDMELGEPSPWFTAWALGDGQAYALIAADASGQKLADNIHEATYRFARAGHGWAAAALSFGQEDLIPYGLAMVGMLSLICILGLAVALRVRIGPRVWWIVLNPALYLGFGGDTSEPLGLLLLVIAMGWSSRISAMLLGVTRPTFLVAAWGRWRLFLPGVGAAFTLVIYSLLAFGPESFIPDGGRLGLPFVSYAQHVSASGVVLAMVAVATIVVGFSTRNWAWLLGGLFILCFGSDVLRDPVNAWRAAGFLPVMWAFGPGYRAGSRPGPPTESPLSVPV